MNSISTSNASGLRQPKPPRRTPTARLGAAILTIALTGCWSIPSAPPTVPKRQPQANLVASPPPLPEPKDGKEETIRRWLDEVIGLYGEMRVRYQGLIDFVLRDNP